MLDFFVIFSKSGIIIFATSVTNYQTNLVTSVVNRLIKNVILEERTDKFHDDQLALQYRLNNEFELVFVVGFQKFLTLTYLDKFLDDVQLAFRDKFTDFDLRNVLLNSPQDVGGGETLGRYNLVDFYKEYSSVYETCSKRPATKTEMRSFESSSKSQKTVGSMIEKPKGEDSKKAKKENQKMENQKIENGKREEPVSPKVMKGRKREEPVSPKGVKGKGEQKGKKGKVMRNWDLGGKHDPNLDFSKSEGQDSQGTNSSVVKNVAGVEVGSGSMRSGKMGSGSVGSGVEVDTQMEAESSEEEESEKKQKSGFFGNIMKSLTFNREVRKEDLDPVLSQLRDHLIGKNVAAEIATRLCESVSGKLEGQHVTTWTGLKGLVKEALEDSMLRILTPNRNVNILRDIKAKINPPFVICFCGVNGVGKSTNLAKISNWLILNGVRVLVIACDTFRAGAVEQLRTHVTALKNIHENIQENIQEKNLKNSHEKDSRAKIELFEKGYGKDSAAIAMEGINYARTTGFNCCLIDTAGRMQDNEPLMKQLAKLIKINEPDLTLFVGEALVGNEAVDQLTKFNTALIDNGCRGDSDNNSAINGIILTKFDTIDDQVGAAISMTYITGQPILFVGVGQTYKDLKQLNAKAVVKALMK